MYWAILTVEYDHFDRGIPARDVIDRFYKEHKIEELEYISRYSKSSWLRKEAINALEAYYNEQESIIESQYCGGI